MNWLAHILLSEPNVENRLGNLLGDLVKGKDLDGLNYNLRRGVERHYAIDKFTDSHAIVKISKKRIDKEYNKFAGILIDVFYDHLLAKNWAMYSDATLTNFTAEIYQSFKNYSEEIPPSARQIIDYMVNGDWLTSYQHLSGVKNALDRIDSRIKTRMGDRIKLVDAMPIMERESVDLEQDFHSFFPKLQLHIQAVGWAMPTDMTSVEARKFYFIDVSPDTIYIPVAKKKNSRNAMKHLPKSKNHLLGYW
jgi:acyl carrier protein phosphodiesterase